MRSLSVVLASAVLVVSAPVAALGATTSITDPAGDGTKGPRLDVTSATLDNRARGIRIRVEVEKVSKGDVLVLLKLKGHKRFTVLSEYDPKEGTVSNFIGGGDQPALCPQITAAWSTSENFVRLRIPGKCLDGGDYDEARFKLLTEANGPADTDLAPAAGDDDKWRWSAYAARG
jgi:hypothetical protein